MLATWEIIRYELPLSGIMHEDLQTATKYPPETQQVIFVLQEYTLDKLFRVYSCLLSPWLINWLKRRRIDDSHHFERGMDVLC